MADRNQLKKAVDSHISDDDPFAELTRIMGFDPREPVAPRKPAAVEKLAALHAEEVDLSLDLEKELMGEFAGLDEDVQATVQEAAQAAPKPAAVSQPAPEAAADDTLTEDFDFVFDADLVAQEHDPALVAAADKALADELHAAFADDAADESVAAETVATGFAGEIPADDTVEAVDDAAVTGEVIAQEAPAEEDEIVAQEALAEEFETAFVDEMVAEEPEMVAVQPVAVAEAVDSLEDQAPLGELEVAEDFVQAAETAEEPVLVDQPDDTFAAHFDDHLAAEVIAEPVAAAPEPVFEPEFAAETELEAELEVSEPEAGPVAQSQESEDDGDVPLIPLGAARDFASADDNFAPVDIDFDAELDKELAQTLDAGAAQPVEHDDDYDLEAELSALLGKSTSVATQVAAPLIVQPSVAEQETAFADEETADEPLVSLDDDWSVDGDDPLPMVAEAHESEVLSAQQYDEAAIEQQDFEPEAPVLYSGPQADVPAMADDEGEAGQGGYDQPEYDAPAYASSEQEPHLEAASDDDEIDPLSEFVVEQELQAELAELDGDLDLALDDLVLDDEPAHAAEAQVHAPEPAAPAAEVQAAPVEIARPVVAKAPFVPVPAPKAPEPRAAEEEEDPFAMLAAMVRETHPVAPPTNFAPPASFAPASMNHQDPSRSNAPTASESPAVPTTEYQYQNHSYTGAARTPAAAPDIDTMDVPEKAVALADDLDIPDIAFEDDQPLAADFDDFEAELASAFHQSPPMSAQPAPEPVREAARDTYQHDYAQYQQPAAQPNYYDSAAAATAAAAYAATRPATADNYADERYGDFDNTALPGSQASGQYQAVADDDDLAYDPELNEDMSIAAYQDVAEGRSSGNRRNLMIAAIVGGVVLIGGIGAYALSGGNGSGTPALVRADTDPVKVRPENPGGTSVPNQDNKVFQTMNGKDTTGAPTQEKLISGMEEPVDMAARAEPRVVTPQPANEDGEDLAEDAPLMADDEAMANDPVAAEIAAAPKGEDRVAPSAEEPATNSETLAVTPRKVRTMVVRSDGTLVPSEEPAPQPQQAEETTASALEPDDPATSLSDPIAPESTGSLTPSAAAPATPAPAAAAPAAQSGMPASGPVAPSRPADQPVDVVGEVKPQQVAAASGAAAAGAWSVQIASQPSEAAAQSSYQDLSRRYGSVIGDKGVNIVKAEIAGKGTFWRVRVPAGSRNDAISLCESYKAAGGNCFVSK
ncbi:SPOR domain-containing protein [Mesorhizobium sp. ZC-5]|uniref:SPOR domain-containing protein n=1 Tax=Mesorhizobium sp. ZC-5 TaxID=2986066 RepID=UPI0021E70DF3|nr:SPOR domain-containing protein [Mesorhizobium sp. ZC-5]MCV3243497.1 SPOR domain-containing protein [Mesorhizobium sp. ZC-5]